MSYSLEVLRPTFEDLYIEINAINEKLVKALDKLDPEQKFLLTVISAFEVSDITTGKAYRLEQVYGARGVLQDNTLEILHRINNVEAVPNGKNSGGDFRGDMIHLTPPPTGSNSISNN